MADRKSQRRALRVLVVALAIEDGQTPEPGVGQVGTFPLLFEEVPADAGDPTISVVSADAEPIGDGRPDAADPPVWPIFLRGDGWTADWHSPRPAIGRVRLTGRLHGELGYTTTGSVRGLITRVRVVSDSFRPADGPGGLERIPGTRRLREVRVAPGNFRDDVIFRAPTATEPDVIRECGVLVDLDLDAAPEPAIRPHLLPGALAAFEDRLWIADQQLPLVVERTANASDVHHILPGQIFPRAETASRCLHGDAEGCWVAGWDGVYRCHRGGAGERLSERPMGASAAIETTLLTYDGTPSEPAELGLWRADGQHRVWEVPAGVVVAIGADEDGFLVVQRATYGIGPGEGRLISVGLDGSMTVGRGLPDVPAHGAVAMDPPRMFDGGGVQSIRPDLTLGRSAPCPVEGLGVTVAGRWLAVVHHDETRPLGDNRRYWMLSLFDSGTLARGVSVEVATPTLGIAVDGAGVVWISDGGVRTVPLGTGDRQIRLDLRELDGGARTTLPPDRPSSG